MRGRRPLVGAVGRAGLGRRRPAGRGRGRPAARGRGRPRRRRRVDLLRHAVHIRITSAGARRQRGCWPRSRSERLISLLDAFAGTRGARQRRLAGRWAGPLTGLLPLARLHTQRRVAGAACVCARHVGTARPAAVKRLVCVHFHHPSARAIETSRHAPPRAAARVVRVQPVETTRPPPSKSAVRGVRFQRLGGSHAAAPGTLRKPPLTFAGAPRPAPSKPRHPTRRFTVRRRPTGPTLSWRCPAGWRWGCAGRRRACARAPTARGATGRA